METYILSPAPHEVASARRAGRRTPEPFAWQQVPGREQTSRTKLTDPLYINAHHVRALTKPSTQHHLKRIPPVAAPTVVVPKLRLHLVPPFSSPLTAQRHSSVRTPSSTAISLSAGFSDPGSSHEIAPFPPSARRVGILKSAEAGEKTKMAQADGTDQDRKNPSPTCVTDFDNIEGCGGDADAGGHGGLSGSASGHVRGAGNGAVTDAKLALSASRFPAGARSSFYTRPRWTGLPHLSWGCRVGEQKTYK